MDIDNNKKLNDFLLENYADINLYKHDFYTCYKSHKSVDWSCRYFKNEVDAHRFISECVPPKKQTKIVPVRKIYPRFVQKGVIKYELYPNVNIYK